MKTYYAVKFIEKEYDVIIELESLLKESIPIMSDLSQEDFGIYSEDGNIMILKLNNKNLYTTKCEAAKRVYASHPSWEEITEAWLSVAKKAVE